jgi:hypothetical protein
VDTPEIIWGCLDTREFLAAAHRLLRASEVHQLLLGGAQRGTVQRRFPLVAHLWPNVQKFRCGRRAVMCLLSGVTLDAEAIHVCCIFVLGKACQTMPGQLTRGVFQVLVRTYS